MKQKVLKTVALTAGCFLSLSALTNVQAQQVISLQKAVDLTLERNLTIKQAKFTEVLATEDVTQAQNNLLPSLSANPQAFYSFGRSQVSGRFVYANQTAFNVQGSAQLQMVLFQGGQLRNQILQNKLILDVDKTNTEKIKNDLILNVVTDYLTILTNQDLVVAAEQQLDLAKLTLDRTEKNVKVGNQTIADLSQAKAGVSTAELNLTTSQNQYDLAVLVLKQYMEMPPTENIKVEKPDISKLTDLKVLFDANQVINTAISVNPDIRLAEAQQKTYAQAVKIAKGNYYPTFGLYSGLGTNYSSLVNTKVTGSADITSQIGYVQGTNQAVLAQSTVPTFSPTYPFFNQIADNFSQTVGVSLQIPIFNRYTARTSVRKAKINYENATVATQLAKNNLSKTIMQALYDLQAAVKRSQSAQQTYQSNKDALNVIQQRFNVGLVNTLDFNTAQTNYNKSQNDMIIAQYEVVFRSKVIDYYLGNPIQL